MTNRLIARRWAMGSVLVAALALGACAMDSMKPMAPGAMTASLNAASEVPPNPSGATGSATVTLSGNTVSWTVTYTGLTGPATAAHFHGPAAPGMNAGVVVPFMQPLVSPITGSKELTDAQVADLKAGKWYVNVHTAMNPGGEIRGQVK